MTAEPTGPAGEGGLVRVRIDLGYDGTAFSGWARQPERRTVQGEVEVALGRVLRLEAAPRLACAGRTDAGVHARGQVAHSDVPAADWHSLATRGQVHVLRRLNGALPPDIRVSAIGPAPSGFDARWSARSRRYSYRVCDDPVGPHPLRRAYVLHRTAPNGARLDVDAMNAAAEPVLGEHDFAAFCRPRAGASTVRTLQQLRWRRSADGLDAGLVVLDVVADAFCHSMVRSLVGVLLVVGEGLAPVERPGELLTGRRRAPEVAPAHALCLEQVQYPPDSELAGAAAQARRFRGPGGAPA